MSQTRSGEQAETRSIRPAVRPATRWPWQRSSGLLATAVDEALLSALSLAVAMALIRGATKEEYGLYTLVIGLVLLVRGAQNALVLTPLATAGGRLRGAERAAFVRALGGLQGWLGALLALALGCGAWLAAGGDAWVLAAGSGLSLIGAWLREFRRAVALLDERNSAALVGDVVFACLACGALLAVWLARGELTAGSALAATGLAAGVAAFIGFRAGPRSVGEPADRRQVIRVVLDQGRWSVPGMFVAWGQNSGYAYAVGVALGAGAVGEIAAARLFLVPLLLTGVAWNRMFLPRAAGLLADDGEALLVAKCTRTLRRLLVGAAIYMVLLAAAWALGLGRLLPPAYAGCEPLVLAWGAYAVLNLARSIASTALIARLQFRALFAMSTSAAISTLLLVIALMGPLGPVGAIAGIAGGELVLTVLAWRALLASRGA